MQKKKWLQKSSTFLNQIILKDMSDGDEGSDKSDKDSEEEEEEEDGEGDGGSSSVGTWDPKASHASYYTFDKKKKLCTYSYSSSSWYGTAVGKKSNTYSIKLGNQATYFMAGFADPSKLNKSSANYSSNVGHYYYPSGNTLYGIGSTGSISGGDCNQGTIYGFKYDKKKGTITIFKNGIFFYVGWQNLKGIKGFAPVLDAYYSNSTYEFVKGKYKKK